MYAGKDNSLSSNKLIGISGEAVKLLLGSLTKQGGTLCIDNWYSSPVLYKQLIDEKTNVCGTVKTKRKYMPKNVETKKMKPCDIKIYHTPKLSLTIWKDKKIVRMLSTIHCSEMIETERKKYNGDVIKKT